MKKISVLFSMFICTVWLGFNTLHGATTDKNPIQELLGEMVEKIGNQSLLTLLEEMEKGEHQQLGRKIFSWKEDIHFPYNALLSIVAYGQMHGNPDLMKRIEDLVESSKGLQGSLSPKEKFLFNLTVYYYLYVVSKTWPFIKENVQNGIYFSDDELKLLSTGSLFHQDKEAQANIFFPQAFFEKEEK